ncbi:MAG: DNA gyrase modulator, partial [Pseudomonadota bacterium]|nr:DNA gyrase modulator [Pseudomonadota bacterium]
MKASISEQVQQQLLLPAGLTEQDLENALSATMTGGVDYADLYFQQSRQENWVLEDGIIKDGGYHLEQGVGVRACSGEKTGFAYSDDLVLPALQQAASAAQAISRQGQEQQVAVWKRQTTPVLYSSQDPILALSVDEKLALL